MYIQPVRTLRALPGRLRDIGTTSGPIAQTENSSSLVKPLKNIVLTPRHGSIFQRLPTVRDIRVTNAPEVRKTGFAILA